MLFVNTKSDIGNQYRKSSIGKYRDQIGSNMKISESDRELKNEIGTSLDKCAWGEHLFYGALAAKKGIL